jgi:hypothetical protein
VCDIEQTARRCLSTIAFNLNLLNFIWETFMSLGLIALIVLVLVLLGVLPTWGHSSSWGYGPSGIVGLIVVVLIVLMLMGRL